MCMINWLNSWTTANSIGDVTIVSVFIPDYIWLFISHITEVLDAWALLDFSSFLYFIPLKTPTFKHLYIFSFHHLFTLCFSTCCHLLSPSILLAYLLLSLPSSSFLPCVWGLHQVCVAWIWHLCNVNLVCVYVVEIRSVASIWHVRRKSGSCGVNPACGV